MEVSSTSNSNIEWSENAKHLIMQLVSIDERNRIDKAEVFEGLYLLWKNNNLVTITVIKDNFIANKNFIKKMILYSLKLTKRAQIDKAQRIYDTLTLGKNFKTPEGIIMFYTSEDLNCWNKKRKIHQRLLNRRFNSLY